MLSERCPMCGHTVAVSERLDLPLVDLSCDRCGRSFTSTRSRVLSAGRALAAEAWQATDHGLCPLPDSFIADVHAALKRALKRVPTTQERRLCMHCYRRTLHGISARAELAQLELRAKLAHIWRPLVAEQGEVL